MLERSEAMVFLKKHVKNNNLIKHMVAVEYIMGGLAEKFGQDVARWRLAGLLHDIDFDTTKDDCTAHSLVGAKMLEDAGLDAEIVQAVRVHNEAHGLPRETMMDKALYCADPLSGFIVAGALIHPDKKLASIDVPFLLKRFGEKAFARGASRETMAACSAIDMELEEFMTLGLVVMQANSEELGL